MLNKELLARAVKRYTPIDFNGNILTLKDLMGYPIAMLKEFYNGKASGDRRRWGQAKES